MTRQSLPRLNRLVWDLVCEWIRLGVWLFLAGLSAVATCGAGAGNRVAVLDVSGERGSAGPIVTLLEQELILNTESVVLLERDRIDTLLDEQALATLNSEGLDSGRAIQTGELWRVDVFCLLERVDDRLRVQLVDTRYGIRIFDETVSAPGHQKMEAGVRKLADLIRTRLSVITPDPADMCLVGVLDFSSVEPTDQLDTEAVSLRTGVEQQLLLLPGVIVLERRTVQPLSRERELTADFPGHLLSSMLLLDGEYHLRKGSDSIVQVYVQALRNGERVFRAEAAGPLDDPRELGAQVAAAVHHKLMEIAKVPGMSRGEEARFLIRRARSIHDPDLALGAVATARALMPDSPEIRRLSLEEQYHRWDQRPLTLSQFRRYLDESGREIDFWFQNPDFDPVKDRNWPVLAFSRCATMWGKFEKVPPGIRKELNGQVEGMFTDCWDWVKHASDLPERNRRSTYSSLFHSLPDFELPDQDRLFRFYAEYCVLADDRKLYDVSEGLVWPRHLSDAQRFAESERFYIWMRDREDLGVRTAGKRGLARLYAMAHAPGKYRRARELYKDYEQAFLDDYLPKLEGRMSLRVGNTQNLVWWIMPFLEERGFGPGTPRPEFYADPEQNQRYRAERCIQLQRRLLTDSHYPPSVNWTWSGWNLEVLEKAGRLEENLEILELAVRHVKRAVRQSRRAGLTGDVNHMRSILSSLEDKLRRFRDAHPELKSPAEQGPEATDPDSRYRSERLWAVKEVEAVFGTQIGYSHLVLQPDLAAVVGRPGVLFLDPDSLKPVRFVPVPGGKHDAEMTAAGAQGIVSIASQGIFRFTRDGTAEVFFRDHPDLSDLYHQLQGVEVLGERVYLLLGGTLLEFDLETGTREILVSGKSNIRKQVLEQIRGVHNVIAYPDRGVVHITLSRRMEDRVHYHVFTFDPESRLYSEVEAPVPSALKGRIRRRDREVTRMTSTSLISASLEPGGGELARYQTRESRFAQYVAVTRVGSGFVSEITHSRELYHFRKSYDRGVEIKTLIYPRETDRPYGIADMAVHPRLGLILLSPKGLHAVPGLNHALVEEE